MIKISLPLLILCLFSCKQTIESIDYFGQTCPDSIPEIFAPGIISIKGRFEHGLSFSPDNKELAFGVLNKDDYSGKIYYSKKKDKNWTEPKTFEPLKSESVYLPYFSPNGKSLLYAQSKPDTNNVYTDIWIINKINKDWSYPKLIPAPISSKSREANACMTYDGTLYFSSNRDFEEKENGLNANLFYSKLENNTYHKVNVLTEFISSRDKESVFISPKENYIIFCSYSDKQTGMDLYISYRDINNSWIEPQVIDSSINSKDWDRRPFVTIDNKFLFFTRLQIGEKGLTESDIYWVNTSKLFKPFVFHPLSKITVQIGKKLERAISKDYFKDINDKELKLSMKQDQYNWIHFDSKQMKLSGLPTEEGDFELTFTAMDKDSNKTEDKVKIRVVK